MSIEDQDQQPRGEVSLARKVDRMGHLIHRYYEAKAHSNGAMGDPLRGQGRVLALLKAKPETTQRELSFLLDMRRQSLSELLAKLEEKGYITREKSQEDGRVTVVRLTDAGSEAAPSPDQMETRADALDCLSEEEQEQLETLTDKVTASLESKLEEMGVDPHQGPRPPRGPRDGGPRDGGRGGYGRRDGGPRDGGRGGYGQRDGGRGGYGGGRDGGRGGFGQGGRGGQGDGGRGGYGKREGGRGGYGGGRDGGRGGFGKRDGGRGGYRPDGDHDDHRMRPAHND